MLARLTDFVETQSGQPSRYSEFVREGRNRYEVEHIWADRPRRHSDEFDHQADFDEYRNRIGGLLLLPCCPSLSMTTMASSKLTMPFGSLVGRVTWCWAA
jgi:hypothetical protein